MYTKVKLRILENLYKNTWINRTYIRPVCKSQKEMIASSWLLTAAVPAIQQGCWQENPHCHRPADVHGRCTQAHTLFALSLHKSQLQITTLQMPGCRAPPIAHPVFPTDRTAPCLNVNENKLSKYPQHRFGAVRVKLNSVNQVHVFAYVVALSWDQ